MQNIVTLIQSVAATALSSRLRSYKYRVYDGSVKRNSWGVEVDPEATTGAIVAHQDGYYIQKAGTSLLIAHKESLIPVALKVGDKVEIKHAGFKATDDGVQDTQLEDGMRMRTFRIDLQAKSLVSPKPFPLLEDMTRQLSETLLKDGRRGIHMLSDLKYSNFRGDANGALSFNPYLEFEVIGAKFTGTVRMELMLGMDVYELQFTDSNGTVKKENVTFDETVELIEEHCDSGPARMATVTVISRAKAPKVSKEALAQAQ